MYQLYDGVVNSPETELTQNISASATTIPVKDASKLPAPPNLAVIGRNEAAETILYTGKSGNALTGVTRGFQGQAKSWSAGAPVARRFTEYDWRAIKDNFLKYTAQPIYNVKGFGAKGDGSTDDTAAIQAAIDYASSRSFPYNGAVVYVPSGIYLVSGLTLKSRVSLVGDGVGVTVLKLKNGSNTSVITVPVDAIFISIRDLSIDGNRDNNSSGHGIYFAPTPVDAGGSTLVTNKQSQSQTSYKYAFLNRLSVSYCKEDGIHIEAYNFAVWCDTVNCSLNQRDGLYVGCTDNLFTNLYLEKNGRCGLYNKDSNNKFINVKSLWNGSSDDTLGSVYSNANRCVFVSIEAQDNYTHGFYLSGKGNQFIGLLADTNGYSKTLGPGYSSRAHSGFYIENLQSSLLIGRVASYRGVPGNDGYWTTEYPYTISGSTPGSQIIIPYEVGRTNQGPQPREVYTLLDAPIGAIEVSKPSSTQEPSVFINPKVQDTTKNAVVQLFQHTNTSGKTLFQVCYGDGTFNLNHELDGKGDATFNRVAGNTQIGLPGTGGKWNTAHLCLGSYHLWVDSSGRLRIKNGAPTSDTDGVVVGAQT